ncbi:MAG TPA: radical SAM family heme chaperone HemW [Anaerolineales bacterium]|nr:radical SAM family heme chaperone HemW [Anaerolineales bacterium]
MASPCPFCMPEFYLLWYNSRVYSLYLHIPFCTHRCAYCDFNTYANQESLIPAYVDALCKEIEFIGHHAERSEKHAVEAHTIFFGGGTPSLLSPLHFDSILKSIRNAFDLTDDTEITIEANPGTVTYDSLRQLREIGVNRISYGVQSANMEELHMLERTHNFFDVIEAVTSARKAGFENLNLDLIHGLPEQSMDTWQSTVKRILDLHPEHISAYALTLEHGTPFGRWASKGLLPLPDPDLAAEMYEWLGEELESAGYVQYEISNWAKPNRECKHNLQYWRGLPYLAFGAGAHGYANGYRYSNVLRIRTYIERLSDDQSVNHKFPLSPAVVNQHKQSPQDDMSEFMMTGLRLTQEGVSMQEFQNRFGRSMLDVFGKEIDELLRLGLVEKHESPSPNERVDRGEGLRLTKHGRLLGNQVFMRFV